MISLFFNLLANKLLQSIFKPILWLYFLLDSVKVQGVGVFVVVLAEPEIKVEFCEVGVAGIELDLDVDGISLDDRVLEVEADRGLLGGEDDLPRVLEVVPEFGEYLDKVVADADELSEAEDLGEITGFCPECQHFRLLSAERYPLVALVFGVELEEWSFEELVENQENEVPREVIGLPGDFFCEDNREKVVMLLLFEGERESGGEEI